MLTLPVSLFRSESMGFGRPKKVGMPTRNKKAVPVGDDVPVTEGIAAVAAEPPSPPPKKAQEPGVPVAPRSPGVLKQIKMRRDAKSMQCKASRLGRVLKRAEEAYQLADRLYEAKDAAVDRARKSKKKGRMHPVVALHKMFVHQNDYLIAHKQMLCAQQVYTWAQNVADARHIAMLQFKVGTDRICLG